MKTIQVGEFKAKFSTILKEVEKGEVYEVTFGKNNEVKGYFVPKEEYIQKKSNKRILGLGRMLGGEVKLGDNFEFTDEELKELFDID